MIKNWIYKYLYNKVIKYYNYTSVDDLNKLLNEKVNLHRKIELELVTIKALKKKSPELFISGNSDYTERGWEFEKLNTESIKLSAQVHLLYQILKK